MKNPSSYFSIRTIQTSTCLEFNTLDEFCQFTKAHQLMDIFLLLNAENEAEYFGAIHNHVLFRHSTHGYKTLEDYHTAIKHDFPNSAMFYAASFEGYNNYEDYKLVKEAGICDKELFEKIKRAHFIAGFEDFQALLQSCTTLPKTETFLNPYHLYQYATQNGFQDYHQFKAAITKGFTDEGIYKIACEHGFSFYTDYSDALQKGFTTFADLRCAKENKVRDRNDLYRFLDLQTLHCDNCFHDQKVMLNLLSKLEQGKRISINKLKDIFKKTLEEYKYQDTEEMPEWFTTSMHTEDGIIEFLQRNGKAKTFGKYDADGEFFEINQMQDRSVVIDGSNIAHNSRSENNLKPTVVNIIKVVEFLQEKGFIEITVIVDASLRHKLADAHKLPELKKMIDYLEAPRETSADMFIIQYVKSNNCLLVSNDTFREWKVKDPWTAENIDFYRLAFMIKGDQVLMPDLK